MIDTYDQIVEELKQASKIDKPFFNNIYNSKYLSLGTSIIDIKKIAKKYLNYEHKDLKLEYIESIIYYFYLNLLKNKADINSQIKFIFNNYQYLDSWVVVDTTYQQLINITFDEIKMLLNSDFEFVKRYGIVAMLPLIKDYNNLNMIFSLLKNSKFYYVNMATGWLISYGFIYYFNETYQYCLNCNLDINILKIAIQKGIDSFRVSNENKIKLKELRSKIKHKIVC
ncbi:MAG: DNA alkylation repair protein [Mollicutes bacterium]|nr:DNA alkylation repair protein [Mollicutes bacterium]MDD7264294.1 DNA alkylation repair protein [bacterium]MDY4979586.1 DNA alkylation repair protein [Candidatus Onthovivens sp.]